MTRAEILERIGRVLTAVLERPDVVVTEKTRAADIEEWDSLNHIQIVVAIEKDLKVKFTSAEIQGWRNVGDVCDAAAKRLG
jgi:acyl carrier protein